MQANRFIEIGVFELPAMICAMESMVELDGGGDVWNDRRRVQNPKKASSRGGGRRSLVHVGQVPVHYIKEQMVVCVNPSAHITRNSPYRLIVRDLEWRLCVHCRPGCRYNWVEACYGANDPTGRLMYEKGIGKKQFRQSILRPDMVRAV